MANYPLPDARMENPAMFLPGKKPVGPVDVNWQQAAKYKLRSLAYPTSGGVLTFSNQPTEKNLSRPNGSNIGFSIGSKGVAVEGKTASSTHTLQLEKCYSGVTDKAWSPTGPRISMMIIVEQDGILLWGNHPIFGINSPATQPYEPFQISINGSSNDVTFSVQSAGSYSSSRVVTLTDGLYDGESAIFVGTSDGTNARLYKNGLEVGSVSTITGAPVYPNDATACGMSMLNFYNYTGQNRLFDGWIYMGAFFDKALTPGEVLNLSNNPYQFLIPA